MSYVERFENRITDNYTKLGIPVAASIISAVFRPFRDELEEDSSVNCQGHASYSCQGQRQSRRILSSSCPRSHAPPPAVHPSSDHTRCRCLGPMRLSFYDECVIFIVEPKIWLESRSDVIYTSRAYATMSVSVCCL